ncbi:MAG: hypothetical protein PHY93_12330 [Bacteriovorax sp.]|nr:hypothetical protein [Bacteriovorax sp.]
MKGIFIILCLSVSLVSCGKLRGQRPLGKIIPTGNIAGLEEPQQHTLKLSELIIAKRICDSLISKTTNIKAALKATPPQQVVYTFNLELKKSCSSSTIEKSDLAAQIILTSGDLEFSSQDNSIYFRDIITEKSAALAAICTEIVNPQTVLEKKVISNATILSNRIYLVALGTNDKGFDTIQINTKTSNAKGGFDPLDIQLISIITDISQDNGADLRNIGVEKERIQYIPCTGKLFTSQKETFVRSYFTL